jgi:hypothetical protein
MTEILLGVVLTLLVLWVAVLHRRVSKLNAGLGHTLKALGNVIEAAQLQGDVNDSQQAMNEIINTNLEILGVHTKLIKPSIGYEATQFLAWYNTRKEENNG